MNILIRKNILYFLLVFSSFVLNTGQELVCMQTPEQINNDYRVACRKRSEQSLDRSIGEGAGFNQVAFEHALDHIVQDYNTDYAQKNFQNMPFKDEQGIRTNHYWLFQGAIFDALKDFVLKHSAVLGHCYKQIELEDPKTRLDQFFVSLKNIDNRLVSNRLGQDQRGINVLKAVVDTLNAKFPVNTGSFRSRRQQNRRNFNSNSTPQTNAQNQPEISLITVAPGLPENLVVDVEPGAQVNVALNVQDGGQANVAARTVNSTGVTQDTMFRFSGDQEGDSNTANCEIRSTLPQITLEELLQDDQEQTEGEIDEENEQTIPVEELYREPITQEHLDAVLESLGILQQQDSHEDDRGDVTQGEDQNDLRKRFAVLLRPSGPQRPEYTASPSARTTTNSRKTYVSSEQGTSKIKKYLGYGLSALLFLGCLYFNLS